MLLQQFQNKWYSMDKKTRGELILNFTQQMTSTFSLAVEND